MLEKASELPEVDFEKFPDGLVPAIVQDASTGKVLMLGYMDQNAMNATLNLRKVTFYSRSKKRLWTKGEESGRFLRFIGWESDCDKDALLIKARPEGPVCHTGTDTCWGEANARGNFLEELEEVIESRSKASIESSYTARLLSKGINKVAQKVGEEAVELVIEAKDNDESLFLGEAADLIFHFLLLLKAKGYKLHHVLRVLEERHKK